MASIAEGMSEKLSTLISILEEMSPNMGEGPYTHALTTAHEQFKLLSDEEKEMARDHVSSRPALQSLILFP